MNQAASASRRSPAGPAATAGCCPMFNAPFFVNQSPLLPPPASQPCFLGTQGAQHAQIAANHRVPNQHQSVNSQLSANSQSQQQQHQHQQQQPLISQQSQNHPNYSRPSPTSCMALAAALAASATPLILPHFQHQPPPPPPPAPSQHQQQPQSNAPSHQPSPIDQAANNAAAAPQPTTVNPVTPNTNPATSTITNQVPLLNFNSYSSAPPFLNLSNPGMHHQGSQSHNVQQLQPQATLPPMPFYSYPQMEQAIALLSNPQVANNIFNHVFNIYLQSSLRSEPQHTHHHHHHLHGAQHHHHHHHTPNGQDATMPPDSLSINETKPRGLNRAEIDSLTPYIHMNEKDSKTCVICLSKFELKSKIRPLPCNHAFHAKCVDKWLRANRSCPICRRDALRTYSGKIKRI